MKKKIILSASLILLVGLAVFVCAVQMDKDIPGYGTIGADYQQSSLIVTNGWNLIKGFPNPEWIFDGDVSQNNIKAIYALDPFTEKYVRFYPKNEDLSEMDITMDYLIGNTAFWVYIEGIEDGGELEYYTMEPWPLDKKQLFLGWNFVGITPEMYSGDYIPGKVGKENGYFALEPIKGDCNILKSYFWSNEQQKFGEWELDLDIDSYDFDKVLNQGLVIKVSSDCTLGSGSSDVGDIPQLPN